MFRRLTMLHRQLISPILVALAFVFLSQSAYSQTTTDPRTGSPETAPASTSNGSDTNAALLRELEAMKQRIEQLEAQLKAKSSANGAPQPTPQPAEQLSAAAHDSVAPTVKAGSPDSSTAVAVSSAPVNSGSAEKSAPFAFADFTWLNGNPRTKDAAFDSKFFTPEVRADVDYTYDFRHPQDDTIGGSSEVFRAKEVQLPQLGGGGDFHYDNVRARFMTQFGMYSTTTPRNDASYSRGQWDLADAYRYLSEAYGVTPWNALSG